MELAIQLIAELIDHLKRENQDVEASCFYCGGLHKTVDCCSQKREEFIQKLLEIQAIAQSTSNEYLVVLGTIFCKRKFEYQKRKYPIYVYVKPKNQEDIPRPKVVMS